MTNCCCINDLRDKEVINVCDGKRLGYVYDVEVDICNGRLVSIIVPGESKCFGFGKGDEIVIPWDNIERIGDDIILVNVSELLYKCNECKDDKDSKDNKSRKKKKSFF